MAWADRAAYLVQVACDGYNDGFLRRWWCRKYSRPSKDPLLAEYTEEELYVEFVEDRIADAGGVEFYLEAHSADVDPREDGERWAEAIEKGEKVDPFEGIDPDTVEIYEALSRREIEPLPPGEEFADDYGGA